MASEADKAPVTTRAEPPPSPPKAPLPLPLSPLPPLVQAAFLDAACGRRESPRTSELNFINTSIPKGDSGKRKRVHGHGIINLDDSDSSDSNEPSSAKQPRVELENGDEPLHRDPTSHTTDSTVAVSLHYRATEERERFLAIDLMSDEEETEDEVETQEDSDEEFVPSTGARSRSQSTLVTPQVSGRRDDHQLMALVLKYIAQLTSGAHKESQWCKIAKQSGFGAPQSARNRVARLLSIEKNSSHIRHSKLSPALREMIRQYRPMRGPPAAKQCVNFRDEEPTDGVHSGTDDAAIRRKSGRAATIKSTSDELLVRLVLLHRDRLDDTDVAMDAWQDVADSMVAKYVKFKSGEVAKARFERLLKLPTNTTLAIPLNFVATKVVEVIESTRRAREQSLRALIDDNDAVEGKPCSKNTIDDLLLSEVIRLSPFHQKHSKAAWNDIAARLKSERYPSGTSCKVRLNTLLRLLGDAHPSKITQTKLAARMCLRLRIVHCAMTWCLSSKQMDHDTRELMHMADTAVNDKFGVLHTVESHPVNDEVKGPFFRASDLGHRQSDRLEEDGGEAPPDENAPDDDEPHLVPSVPLLNQNTDDEVIQCPELDTARPPISQQNGVMWMERGHHLEFSTMIEMMKADREVRHREMATMLALIQEERTNHRNEFLAMMNLLHSRFRGLRLQHTRRSDRNSIRRCCRIHVLPIHSIVGTLHIGAH